MDIRPPAYRQHHPPLDSFRAGIVFHLLTVALCRLHRASYTVVITHRCARRSIKGAFQGVTPSFHPSEYQLSFPLYYSFGNAPLLASHSLAPVNVVTE